MVVALGTMLPTIAAETMPGDGSVQGGGCEEERCGRREENGDVCESPKRVKAERRISVVAGSIDCCEGFRVSRLSSYR